MDIKEDYLNRKKDVENVAKIIEYFRDRKSTSFAINGNWGSGKTFFLEMLFEKLNKKYFVFKYDSWENDYYDEPLIGMLVNIRIQLSSYTTNDQKILKKIKTIVSIIGSVLDEIIFEKSPIKPFKIIKSITKKTNEIDAVINDFDPFDKIRSIKELIILMMNELSDIHPVIFLVDEIDRCSPQYSIKIIERIHHISANVKKCISIFSVDFNQLKTIIGTFYGNKEETINNYLRKIICFTYELGNGQLDEKFEFEISKLLSLFDPPCEGISNKDIKEFIYQIFNGLEIRKTLQILSNAEMIHNLLFQNEKIGAEFICAELMLSRFSLVDNAKCLEEMCKFIINGRHNNSFEQYLYSRNDNIQMIFQDNVLDRQCFCVCDLKTLMLYGIYNANFNYFPHFPKSSFKEIPSNYMENFVKFGEMIFKVKF